MVMLNNEHNKGGVGYMADYAEMYKVLFRSITQAIEILQKAQQATEEIYISSKNPIITILPPNGVNENKDGNHS